VLTDDGFLSPLPDDLELPESLLPELPEDALFAASEPLDELSEDPLDPLDPLAAESLLVGTALEPFRLSVR
jgi:hypothetical protein